MTVLATTWFDPDALPVAAAIDILAVLLLLTAVAALILLRVLRRQRRRMKLGERRLQQQLREIAEARQAGSRARATEQNLREITQRVPLVVFAVRRDGRAHRLAFRAGNIRALFGLDWQDLLDDDDVLRDWPFQDRIHPEDHLRLRQLMRRAMRRTQTTSTLDFRAYGEAGLRWIHLLVVARHLPGEDAHWIGYFIDTTSINADNESLRAARNAAERASRAKADFLATMSHEIRTPMNGVIGMLELLGHTRLDAEQRELLGAVEDSAGVLLQVLNDVLDFSKLETGELRLDPVPFDPRILVDNVVGAAATPMRRKGLRIVVRADANLAGRLLGDSLRLRQILLNLLGNASKFTERGSITVAVHVAGDDGRHQRLHLSVADTGIGIPVERQAGLFQPFAQAEASTARDYGGTGLGLSICRHLVELMDGRIDLDSEPGRGTTVTVKLRLPVVQREIDRPEPLAGRHAVVRLRAPALATALGAHLEALGLTVEVIEPSTPLRQGMAANLLFVDAADDGGSPRDIAAHVITLDAGPDAPASPRMRGECIVLGANPLRWQALVNACMLALAPSVPSATGEAVADATPARPGRILVAEDHPVNQALVRRQLELLGWSSEVVGDGREALEALHESDYDLLLTDCRMPVMDGYELARAWRDHEARHAPGRHLPIVAMTAHAVESEIMRCREAGMDDCLGKPVQLRPLGEKIAAWLPVDLQVQGTGESRPRAQGLHGDVLHLLLETSCADLEALEHAAAEGSTVAAAERLHRLLGAWRIFSDDATLADGQRLLDALEGPRAADALSHVPTFVGNMRQLMDEIAMSSAD